jgi:RNA polymerase sigma-70 factor (ECF subfamily)
VRIDAGLAERLLRRVAATPWRPPPGQFADTLAASAARAFAGRESSSAEIEAYLASLHLDDLAIACACANGSDQAWEHFVREQRPVLYRSADALEAGGGARDLADSLYGELFGVGASGGQKPSLFRHYHGRSSLATWLRAVLAQRYVDRMRSRRRAEAAPDDEAAGPAAAAPGPDPDRSRRRRAIEHALRHAVAQLPPRDRLRLGCYYAEGLTLAQTGRLLREHEATVSRQLARTRKAIREAVARQLKDRDGLAETAITEAFEEIAEDPGALDLGQLLAGAGRKDSLQDRSKEEGPA